ncbi:MAG: aromatic ring-hydroxylating oxygenase subunit alpha [Solirubrobacteraceae bacterium]
MQIAGAAAEPPILDLVAGSPRTLAAAWYTSPEILELEYERILRRGWQYAGAAATVAEPGSYTTTTSGAVPIVVTRDEAGQLHALANVCRHRGAQVAEGSGRRKLLSCPYHAWSYRLDGTLRAAPRFEGLDCAQHRLPTLRAATWGPLLFVSANPDVEPLSEHLEGFPQLVAGTGLDADELRLYETRTHVIGANWKAVVDNFIECYHCQLVHPAFRRDYDVANYRYASSASMECQSIRDESRFAFAYLWPNSQFSVFVPALVARAITPQGPHSTSVRFDYYFTPSTPAAERAETVEYFEQIVREDIPVCESVQRGLRSGAYERGPLNPDSEQSVIRFQRRVTAALRGAALDE